MKKIYFLLVFFVLPFLNMLSQNIEESNYHFALSKEKITKAQSPILNKAFGDTLHYEDFSTGSINSLPQGWSVNSNVSVQTWRWSTTAPGGQYSTVGPLNSTSTSNGFMSLPLDSMNTPTPSGGFRNITAQMTSSAIAIQPTASVLISFQHALRYCCIQSTVDIKLEVSTDSLNWDSYDASRGINPSQHITNASVDTINVSRTLAFEDTAYLRFKMSGASHYYWMIDDIVFLEGYENQWVITDYSVEFTNNFQVNPVFTILPNQLMTPLSFQVSTHNEGVNTRTNAFVDLEVIQDSTWLGGAGNGIVFSDSTLVGNVIAPYQFDTVHVGPYYNGSNGHYRAKLSLVSDSANFQPKSRVTYPFAVSDTVLAKDRNRFSGRAGVGSYIDPNTQSPGGNQGDMMLTVVSIVGVDSVLATSLSFYVANYSTNDGVQIVPVIYQFGGAPSLPLGPTNLIAQNLNPTTIDSSMFDSWVTIDFASGGGTGNAWLYGGQQYAIGWRQANGGNGEAFYSARAFDMEQFQPSLSNFINFQGNSWGWVYAQPAVRLNLGNLIIVGEEELESQAMGSSFRVFPNPTNGEITLTAESTAAKSYHLIVRNVLGQVVYSETIAVNGQMTKNMNLNNMDKGIYFVSLENDEEKMVQKVVLK